MANPPGTPTRKRAKLGAAGIALVILLVISLVLSALFCAVPWPLTMRRAAAQAEATAQGQPSAQAEARPQGERLAQRPDAMTLIYADDDSTDARKQINAANAKFLQAWKTGDAELFASCFAEDGVYLLPGRPPVLGREGVLTRMKDVFSRVRMSEGEITTIDFYLLGNTVYETGKAEYFVGPIGKKPKKESGYYVAVWRKEGTKWKMWRDIGVPNE